MQAVDSKTTLLVLKPSQATATKMNENAKEYLSGIKGFAGVKRPAVLTEEELEVAVGQLEDLPGFCFRSGLPLCGRVNNTSGWSWQAFRRQDNNTISRVTVPHTVVH